MKTHARWLVLLFAFCFPFSGLGELAWTQAPAFTNGMALTSSNYNRLVNRFEDIGTSGIGDVIWRQFWYAHSMLRNVIGSTAEPTPPDDYAWQVYLHLDPEKTEDMWGLEPGAEDGLNLYQPWIQWLYGNDAGGVWDESSRLQDFPVADAGTTALDGWEIGKQQRGWITNGVAMPTNCARRVATEWRRIRVNAYGNTAKLFNTTWGGWLPEWGPTADYSDFVPYHFTPLKGALTALDFSQWDAGYNEPTSITYTPDAYKVVVWHTSTNFLNYDDYLLGPATGKGMPTVGASAMQFPGHALDFMLQAYCNEYAGSVQQRTNEAFRLSPIAFDFQRFLTNQYRLAPAFSNVYPVVTVSTSTVTTTNLIAHAGFVFAGAKLSMGWSNASTVTIRSTNGLILLGTAAGAVSNRVIWFDKPQPAVTVATSSTNAGNCAVEFAELEQRTPDIEDCTMLLRLASTDGVGAGAVDNPGRAVTNAASYTVNYFRSGCLTGLVPPSSQGQDPAQSPVWNAFRRQIRDNMRAFTRDMFVSYSVSNDVYGVLTFNRSFMGLDNWDGLAPAIGDVTGTNLICTLAPSNGWNNRWVMIMSSHPYNDSIGSPWKPDSYGDVLTFLHDRCHCLSQDLDEAHGSDLRFLLDPEFRISEDFGQPVMVSPGPSGFRYARTVNTGGSATNFFRSCQIYPKPYEVIAVYNAGSNAVRVVLDRPLTQSFAGERTDANVISDYLAYLNGTNCPIRPGDFALSADGRETVNTNGTSTEDLYGIHNGACHPRFYFARLPRRCYEDTNNTYQSHDTRPTAQDITWMGWLLQSWCEGFLNPFSGGTAEAGCAVQACWTYPDLCYATRSSRWFDMLTGPEMRAVNRVGILGTNWGPAPTRPISAGPLANTVIYAETLDRIANAVNLLVEAPLDVPITVWSSNVTYVGWTAVPMDASVGPGAGCSAQSLFGTNDVKCATTEFGTWCKATNGESGFGFWESGASSYNVSGAMLTALPWLPTATNTWFGDAESYASAVISTVGFYNEGGSTYGAIVVSNGAPVVIATKRRAFVRVGLGPSMLAIPAEIRALTNSALKLAAWTAESQQWYRHVTAGGSHNGPGVCLETESCFTNSLLVQSNTVTWACARLDHVGQLGDEPIFELLPPDITDTMLSVHECSSGETWADDGTVPRSGVVLYPAWARMVVRVPFK